MNPSDRRRPQPTPPPATRSGSSCATCCALGTWGFGGPVALVGYMYRDLVEKRRWISESDYKEGMALAQLMPGPLAAQLAIYLGYVHYRILGATLVGLAFVLPSFLMVVALGAAYVALRRHRLDAGGVLRRRRGGDRHHRDERLQADHEEHRQGQAAVGDLPRQRGGDRRSPKSEIVWIFLGAGVLVWLVRAPPKTGSAARLHSRRRAARRPRLRARRASTGTCSAQIGAFFA